MADETATNPVEAGDNSEEIAGNEAGVETEGQEAEQLFDDDGNPIESEPDEDEEVDLDDVKVKVPKDVAVKLKELKEGNLRQADYTRKTQELSDQRKAFDAERGTFQQTSQAEIDALAAVRAHDGQLAQYQNIDWDAWEEQDPFAAQKGWRQFQSLQNGRANAANQFMGIRQQRALTSQQDIAKRTEETRQTLTKDIPGWSEETKARLTDFALTKYGFTAAEAADMNIDPRIAKVLNDAFGASKASSTARQAQSNAKAQEVKQAVTVGRSSAPPASLSDRQTTDAWMRDRNKQVQRRA